MGIGLWCFTSGQFRDESTRRQTLPVAMVANGNIGTCGVRIFYFQKALEGKSFV